MWVRDNAGTARLKIYKMRKMMILCNGGLEICSVNRFLLQNLKCQYNRSDQFCYAIHRVLQALVNKANKLNTVENVLLRSVEFCVTGASVSNAPSNSAEGVWSDTGEFCESRTKLAKTLVQKEI